jgi:hypothetical protein
MERDAGAGSEMELAGDSETVSEMESEIASEIDSESGSEMDSHMSSQKNLDDGGYNNRNFTCDASVSTVDEHDGSQRTQQAVEFWPLHRIEPRAGVEVTWGEQYVSFPPFFNSLDHKMLNPALTRYQPELYRLAIQAAKNGSEAAMEMLIRLPSMNVVFSGWLLEYEFAEELKDELLLSRRWVFKQARKIDGPSTMEEKRKGLERLIAAY